MFAVFIDKVKISEYGNLYYVKAMDYKSGKASSHALGRNTDENTLANGKSPRGTNQVILTKPQEVERSLSKNQSKKRAD